MHRIATVPIEGPTEDLILVEQPPAEVLFLTSASNDIAILDTVLNNPLKVSFNPIFSIFF